MICDYLHDFYTMPALIYVGGVPTTVHLRWYRAPAGAKILPIPNAIHASSVWEADDGYSGQVGELYQPRAWDPGRNVGYQGQCYLGDPSWFATGQLPAYVLTQAPPPSACLCKIPPAQASGALVLSGSATASTSICQQGVAPVKVDTLDGTGPHSWSFQTGIGVFYYYAAGPAIAPRPAVGISGVGQPGACIVVGTLKFSTQPPPGHYVFNQLGACQYLIGPKIGRWDFLNDGSFVGVIYTT